jgi:hypothetical protein
MEDNQEYQNSTQHIRYRVIKHYRILKQEVYGTTQPNAKINL